jgi:F1F0 ATPase subunit 2
MSEILMLGFALLAGILLGAIFFGGLWWTVLKGVSARQPGFWFVVSLLLRTGLAMAGFYFVSGDSWKRLLACLFGFILARMIVTRLANAADKTAHLTGETGHAP